MPDSVFICSKPKDGAGKPQGLYANRKMNNFFGQDIVNSNSRKKRDKKYPRNKCRDDRNAPLKRTIFESFSMSNLGHKSGNQDGRGIATLGISDNTGDLKNLQSLM